MKKSSENLAGMKKLDFNFKFKNLDGKELNENAGKTLANLLAAETQGDSIKQWSLATRIYSGEPIEVDESDKAMIVELVRSTQGLTALAKSQLLIALQ